MINFPYSEISATLQQLSHPNVSKVMLMLIKVLVMLVKVDMVLILEKKWTEKRQTQYKCIGLISLMKKLVVGSFFIK